MIYTLYKTQDIVEILEGKFMGNDSQTRIKYLLIDSRKILHPIASIYFALTGERHDGHDYIAELYDKGVRNFVISIEAKNTESFPEANFIKVKDTTEALQKLAAVHRQKVEIPVIAITGSNGKTMVKEWLGQLLYTDWNLAKSPKSFNSQVGVPLSIWQLNPDHTLGLFEAGISQPGEMEKLEEIIKPTIGLITNIGDAHNEGFENIGQKVNEKLLLFKDAETLVYCSDYAEIAKGIEKLKGSNDKLKTFSWSKSSKADLSITDVVIENRTTRIKGSVGSDKGEIEIPFTDEASIENAIHCWALMLCLEYKTELIAERIKKLAPVAMRLELKAGINNCTVINDSYNSDLGSLEIALDFLNQQSRNKKKTVILSDIFQSGKDEKRLYKEVSNLIDRKGVDRIMGIGEDISHQAEQFSTGGSFYESTEDFLTKYSGSLFHDEVILIKGARPFKFEEITKVLQQKTHETVLEVNLEAIVYNLNVFRSLLKPETQIMAMVKAFSYGSGSYEIANVLQFHRVDYLAVAYADEGVELRNSGITIPIMVMNPEDQSYDSMIMYNLEPEIYNFHVLQLFAEALAANAAASSGPVPIHIKLETGMHRLGFEEDELDGLIAKISEIDSIYVQSVFSHLAASEQTEHDDFSLEQIEQFKKMSEKIISKFDYPIMRHILNSRGIMRFEDAQFDMVRLGIGIYGIDDYGSINEKSGTLHNVSTLKSSISQIKKVQSKDTIGYGRHGVVDKDMTIAIVPIGYADGLNRKLGNGRGKLLIKGKFAPTIGDICMDMCMVDITEIDAQEGEEVIVFGENYSVTEFAKDLETIPYEVLTSISRRVKRVYYHE